MTNPLPQGSTIGILGGGQLGRMLAVAAARLGLKTHIYEPTHYAPAADVAHRLTTASYEDDAALCAFGVDVDVITYEFENIPTHALDLLQDFAPIRPARKALAISQDRLIEKQFLTDLDLACAPFYAVANLEYLTQALTKIGLPAILKTTRLGYDGKGQVRIDSAINAPKALAEMNGSMAVLEGFISFTDEVSVIAARGFDGAISAYDPGENIHKNGILHQTTVPAKLTSHQRTDAVLIAAKILNALDYVGVMGVELFVTSAGFIVNEIAPRVHNSGHWTQNGCAIDQFEQHIRAVAGWPLGDGQRYADVVMENLIGDDMDHLPKLAAEPNTALHLYGKPQARLGRKMGHINRMTRPKA
jgi:5-(carboxyamino)imidazole ribonucleotide synthase